MSDETQENPSIEYDGFDLNDESVRSWDGEPGFKLPNIEPGEHHFEVKSCTIEDNKNGNGKNLVVVYTCIDDGPAFGEDVKQWYVCGGENFKSGHMGRIKRVIKEALQVPINSTGGFNTAHVVGRRMYATFALEETTRYEPLTQQQRQVYNPKLSLERPDTQMTLPTVAAAPARPTAAVPAAPSKAASAPASRPPAPSAPANRPPSAPPRPTAPR